MLCIRCRRFPYSISFNSYDRVWNKYYYIMLLSKWEKYRDVNFSNSHSYKVIYSKFGSKFYFISQVSLARVGFYTCPKPVSVKGNVTPMVGLDYSGFTYESCKTEVDTWIKSEVLSKKKDSLVVETISLAIVMNTDPWRRRDLLLEPFY